MTTTNVFSFTELARNSKIAVDSQWVCINGVNAGRIAEVRTNPYRSLYWVDNDDAVDYKEGNLFVNKQR